MAIARDKFWIFGVRPHQDDVWLSEVVMGQNRHSRFKRSRITPAEAALMLDVPNMLMINCNGEPAPYSEDAYGYAESFCRLKNVLWGATGSSGFRAGNEEKFICDLAKEYPNIKGAFMDDFFSKFRNDAEGHRQAKELLKEIRGGLDKACRPMELYMVYYTRDTGRLDEELAGYLDGITLWTSLSADLVNLEENFEKIEKKFPSHKKLLGVYMYDFRGRHPISDELMEHQCEFGLRMMKEGRIHGMIFEANSVMGVGLSSERWLRNWVEKVKNTPIPD